jgi:hypothetical protein
MAGVAKDQARAGAARGRRLHPILFTVMFTYLFGGALSGSSGTYLQSLLPGRWR